MKTLYSKRALSLHAICLRQSIRTLFLFHLFMAMVLLSFSQTASKLDFRNGVLQSGSAGADGAVYRFPNVANNIDALINIKGRSNNLVYLVDLDMSSSGFDKALQPQVGYNKGKTNGPAEWWMDFEISFVKKNTTELVTVEEFDVSAIDIDGNGHLINEYVTFYGLKSYLFEANSLLSVSDIFKVVNGASQLAGKRFDGPITNFVNIDTNGTAVMVTTTFTQTNKFIIRTGGVSLGASSATERMNSFYFKGFNYHIPSQVTLPVNLKSFSANLSSSKVILNWTSSGETNFSHYVVERSTDGKVFNDVTVIFANSNNGSEISYTYSDNLNSSTNGIIYYRLKMTDQSGEYKYSLVRIIKVGEGKNLTVSTYPNPVSNELRITIPDTWQNKQVVYNVYNSGGQMVKHFVANRASQTETMQMNDIKPGAYVIRLNAGNESATQQIVKSK